MLLISISMSENVLETPLFSSSLRPLLSRDRLADQGWSRAFYSLDIIHVMPIIPYIVRDQVFPRDPTKDRALESSRGRSHEGRKYEKLEAWECPRRAIVVRRCA